MNDETHQKQTQKDARQDWETALHMAAEAGRQHREIPQNAKGNEPLLKQYKDALKEREPRLNDAEKRRADELDKAVDRAIIEAQQVREAVGREKQNANDFHLHAQPGETYRGRVIGRTDSFVIQADDARPGTVVLHDRKAVSGEAKVKMNEHAEISYPHGRAGIARDTRQVQHGEKQAQKQAQIKGHERER
ncbi:KfrB domain-containing protein (plasmid) [Escherichia coli]